MGREGSVGARTKWGSVTFAESMSVLCLADHSEEKCTNKCRISSCRVTPGDPACLARSQLMGEIPLCTKTLVVDETQTHHEERSSLLVKTGVSPRPPHLAASACLLPSTLAVSRRPLLQLRTEQPHAMLTSERQSRALVTRLAGFSQRKL